VDVQLAHGRLATCTRIGRHGHLITIRTSSPVLIRRRALPGGASADLFGQGDDDACGAAEVAEPVDALVLRHLAEEFGAVGP
jgi:hypothetical protein